MENKITTVIFDFDNTLFDSMQLKFLFRGIAQVNGFNDEESRNIYAEARNDEHGIIAITLERYVDEVRRRCEVEGKKFHENATRREVEKIKNIGIGLLLSGANELIDFCKEKKLNYYLLSLGVRDWQLEKMRWVGMDKIFNNKNTVFTVKESGGKVEAMQALFGNEFTGQGAVLINDRIDESADLLDEFPDLKVFLRRDERDERSIGETVVKNLLDRFGDRIVIVDNLVELLRVFKTYVE